MTTDDEILDLWHKLWDEETNPSDREDINSWDSRAAIRLFRSKDKEVEEARKEGQLQILDNEHELLAQAPAKPARSEEFVKRLDKWIDTLQNSGSKHLDTMTILNDIKRMRFDYTEFHPNPNREEESAGATGATSAVASFATAPSIPDKFEESLLLKIEMETKLKEQARPIARAIHESSKDAYQDVLEEYRELRSKSVPRTSSDEDVEKVAEYLDTYVCPSKGTDEENKRIQMHQARSLLQSLNLKPESEAEKDILLRISQDKLIKAAEQRGFEKGKLIGKCNEINEMLDAEKRGYEKGRAEGIDDVEKELAKIHRWDESTSKESCYIVMCSEVHKAIAAARRKSP